MVGLAPNATIGDVLKMACAHYNLADASAYELRKYYKTTCGTSNNNSLKELKTDVHKSERKLQMGANGELKHPNTGLDRALRVRYAGFQHGDKLSLHPTPAIARTLPTSNDKASASH